MDDVILHERNHQIHHWQNNIYMSCLIIHRKCVLNHFQIAACFINYNDNLEYNLDAYQSHMLSLCKRNDLKKLTVFQCRYVFRLAAHHIGILFRGRPILLQRNTNKWLNMIQQQQKDTILSPCRGDGDHLIYQFLWYSHFKQGDIRNRNRCIMVLNQKKKHFHKQPI